MQPKDPDATIVVRRPAKAGAAGHSSDGGKQAMTKPAPEAPSRRGLLVAGGAGFVVLAAGATGYMVLRRPPVVPQAPIASPPTEIVPSAPPLSSLALRNEAEILAQQAVSTITVKFEPNPRILVIDFPDLRIQGLTFNRIAAYPEKAGLPRDRVLDNRELADAVKADNATTETYYYGHDYRAVDLARFFTAAKRQGMALGAEEIVLRDVLETEGLLAAGVNAAVISLPREGSDPFVDASGRASLLRHELSHGQFFTDPDYAAFSRHFWADVMNDVDRASFRGFLTRQGYDAKDEDLLINETQAHLMHTTDGRYFNARDCGLPRARIDELRARFAAAMPTGWLKAAVQQSVASLP